MTIASLVQLDRCFLLVLLVLCGVLWWSYWTCTGISKSNKNKTTIYIYRCTKPHRQQIITNKQNNKMFGKWVHFWVLARNYGPLILLEPCGFCQDSARHFGPWILLELSTLFFVPVNVSCTPWKDKGPAFPTPRFQMVSEPSRAHNMGIYSVLWLFSSKDHSPHGPPFSYGKPLISCYLRAQPSESVKSKAS